MNVTQVRRRDAATTRARILKAAQVAFSTTGYSHTGIRKIGALAGTTGTMLGRYFGSKAALFEAALIDAMNIDQLLRLPHETFGRTIVRSLLDPDNDIRPPLMIAMAAGDPEAKEIALRVIERELVLPLSSSLQGAHSRARALGMMMLVTGFITYIRQVPLQLGDENEFGSLCEWFSKSFQALVDGETPHP